MKPPPEVERFNEAIDYQSIVSSTIKPKRVTKQDLEAMSSKQTLVTDKRTVTLGTGLTGKTKSKKVSSIEKWTNRRLGD